MRTARVSYLGLASFTLAIPIDASLPPVINPNRLTTTEDQGLAVAAFKRIQQMWARMSDVTIGPEYLPGPAVDTDEETLEFIQQSVAQLYHASATCKMGRSNTCWPSLTRKHVSAASAD